jgi:Tol biopolymer transport system component
MRHRATFFLLLLGASWAAAALTRAAQPTVTAAYDIAFASSRDGQNGIYRMRGDGAQPSLVVSTATAAVLVSGSWSPDGRSVLIHFSPARIVDVATGATSELGNGMMDPTFAPDGRCVVYRTSEAGVWNIYAVDVNSSDRRKLSANPGGASHFAVSPLLRR